MRSVLLTVLFALLLSRVSAFAETPYDPNQFELDNAAYWYRKAFAEMEQINIQRFGDMMEYRAGLREADEEIKQFDNYINTYSEIRNYIKQDIELSESIKAYLAKHQKAIKLFKKGASISKCDWGYDLENISPDNVYYFANESGRIADGIQLILCDSLAHAEAGKFQSATQKWLDSFNMSSHYQLLLSGYDEKYGLGYYDVIPCTAHLLPLLSGQQDCLESIHDRLKQYLQERPSRLETFDQDTKDMVKIINSQKDELLTRTLKDPERQILLEGTFDIEQFITHRKKLREIWDMDFETAYQKIEAIKESFLSDAVVENNIMHIDINSYVIAVYDRNIMSSFGADYFFRSQENALYIASVIYLGHAKTGSLPGALPAGIPEDPFSNKPYIYEQTPDGFKLKCRGKDIRINRQHEYEFKLPEVKSEH